MSGPSGQADIRKWFAKGRPKEAKTEEPEPVMPSSLPVQPGSGFKGQKPVLQRPTCGDAVKSEVEERKRRPSASPKDEPPMKGKRRKPAQYEEEEDEDEEADLDFLEEEEEEEEAPKRKKPARGRASTGATPKKSEAKAVAVEPSPGRGGAGGAGRGGRGGGGGGRGWGRGTDAPPPHKGEKEVPEGPEDALAGLTFVITGTLDSLEREEAEDLIKRHGGRLTGSVSKKTVSGAGLARGTAPTSRTAPLDWPLPSTYELDAAASPRLWDPASLESCLGGLTDEPGNHFAPEFYLRSDPADEAWAHLDILPHGVAASFSASSGGEWCISGAALERATGNSFLAASPRAASSGPYLDEFPIHTSIDRGREQNPQFGHHSDLTGVAGVRQEHSRQSSCNYKPVLSSTQTFWEEPCVAAGELAGRATAVVGSDDVEMLLGGCDFGSLGRGGVSGVGLQFQQYEARPGAVQEMTALQLLLEDPLQSSRQREGCGVELFDPGEAMAPPSRVFPVAFSLPHAPEPALGSQGEGGLFHSDAAAWEWPSRAGGGWERESNVLSDCSMGRGSGREGQSLADRERVLSPGSRAWLGDCTPFLPPPEPESNCTIHFHGHTAKQPRYHGRTTTHSMREDKMSGTTCWTGQPPCGSAESFLLTEDENSETSKARKAKELGVKQLKEDGLFDLIRKSAAKASSTKKPAPTASPLKVPPRPALQSPAASSTVRGVPRPAPAVQPPGGPKTQRLADSNGTRATAASGSTDTEAWPQKWAPKTLADLVGNPSLVKQLRDWLQNWHDVHGGGPKKGGPKKGGRMGGVEGLDKKAVLLSGPPGIGKTTSAALVAADLGFTPMEVNASDSRGKSDSKVRNGMGGSTANAIKEMVSNTSISFKSSGSGSSGGGSGLQERAVLIMDEVDGMSGGDRGGVSDLILSIKASRVPIICICNDRYSQKLKSLVNHCFTLNFRKPTRQQMAKRLKFIATKEGLNIPENALEELGEMVNGDMRMALNQLQYMSLRSKSMSYTDVKTRLQSSAKDEDIKPMAACDTLLGYGASRLSFDRLLDAAMSDMDLMPLMVQENYLNHVPACASADTSGELLMQRVSAAADAITLGDLVNVQIRRHQQWQHLQFSGFMSCITPGLLMNGRRVTLEQGERNFARFPGWLGKNSTAGKNRRLLDELRGHMVSAKAAASPSWQAVRMDYVECLERSIFQPLKSHDPEEGVQCAADLMEDYALTPEDLETATAVSKFKGRPDPAAGVPPAVKGKLTRELRKRMQDSKARSSAMLPPVALHGGRGKTLAASFRPKKGARKGKGGSSEAWLDTSAVQADPDMPMPVEEGTTLQADEDAEEDGGDDNEEVDNDEESTRQRLLGAPAAKETKRKGKQDGAAPRGRGKKAKG